jgi:hypothetical protein
MDYAQLAAENIHPAMGQEILNTYSRAVQYMNYNIPAGRDALESGSLRKRPETHGLDMKEFKFLRQHKVITNPLSVLDKLEDGTVSREEVSALRYVYPEIHGEIVGQAVEHIAEMKAQGKFLPMDKIVSLGIVLDSPVDSTLTKEFIGEVQKGFQYQQSPDEPPRPAEDNRQSLVSTIQAVGTPLEQALV